MRTILLILLPFMAFAQCEYNTYTVDTTHNIISIATKPLEISKGVSVSFTRLNTESIIYFTSDAYGCSSGESFVILDYLDGTSKLISQIIKADICDHPTIGGVIKEGKGLRAIRLYFAYQIQIPVENQDFIIQGLNCLTSNGL